MVCYTLSDVVVSLNKTCIESCHSGTHLYGSGVNSRFHLKMMASPLLSIVPLDFFILIHYSMRYDFLKFFLVSRLFTRFLSGAPAPQL